jgi:hypothetical protein
VKNFDDHAFVAIAIEERIAALRHALAQLTGFSSLAVQDLRRQASRLESILEEMRA